MRRSLYSLFCFLLAISTAWPASLDRQQREATVRYVVQLQNPDGGFRPTAAPANSQLGAITACLRALKYMGGTPRDRTGCARFVQRCYDPPAGGFAETPGGPVSVRSTAMGLMAVAELKLPLGPRAEAVTGYFVKNAHTVPDLYLAEAALDAAGLKPPGPSDWLAPFEVTRHPDGSYGQNVGDTARAVVTFLRLGRPLKDWDIRVLKAAQRPDGGFPAAGGASDLPTTYPVMRALFMLREKPDLEKCRDFVNRCRNADGGYGAAPGQPSSAATTYFASIILHWIDALEKV